MCNISIFCATDTASVWYFGESHLATLAPLHHCAHSGLHGKYRSHLGTVSGNFNFVSRGFLRSFCSYFLMLHLSRMPNLGASSGGRVPRRPKSMGSCNEKNAEHFTVAGKSKSTTPPVRDGSFHAREEFESRPNNLVSKCADVLFKG